ncbi:MAG: hypothetical protein MUP47_05290 [Phycisphaerae bacterium]|nr:hypothetical protein [Phycisphaerae bacterium]
MAAADIAEPAVDRGGGELGAGMIRGISLVTRGEALGHGYWLDREFVGSVQTTAAAAPRGVKARFSHPTISDDGLGTFLGRAKSARLVGNGDKAAADLHFSAAAHRTPDGNLATYVMDLAEEDPAAFGVSIVLEHDVEAEIAFALEHGANWTADEYGEYLDFTDFKSPDPDNVDNLPHARLQELRAADVVDDPAANPEGLFHREQQIAQEADGLLAYALGLAAAPPTCEALSVHPERIKGFVARFLESHGLQVNPKESLMSPTAHTVKAAVPAPHGQAAMTDPPPAPPVPAPQAPDGQPPGAQSVQEPPLRAAVGPPAQPGPQDAPPPAQPADGEEAPQVPQAPAEQASARQECSRFVQAFGTRGGEWFAAGLSFEQAQAEHAKALTAENAKLRTRLAQAGLGEAEPVSVQPPEGTRRGLADVIRI